jgi:hypothetical protein
MATSGLGLYIVAKSFDSLNSMMNLFTQDLVLSEQLQDGN